MGGLGEQGGYEGCASTRRYFSIQKLIRELYRGAMRWGGGDTDEVQYLEFMQVESILAQKRI